MAEWVIIALCWILEIEGSGFKYGWKIKKGHENFYSNESSRKNEVIRSMSKPPPKNDEKIQECFKYHRGTSTIKIKSILDQFFY